MLDDPYACNEQSLLKDLHCERFRSSGPGGQHAQKTNSAVRLRHRESGVSCQCQDHREYQRNFTDALQEMRLRLAMHYRGFGNAALFAQRCQGERLKVSVHAQDFHLLLGYVFDVLEECDWDTRTAAQKCALSHSQLCKFLKLNKLVWQGVNDQRVQRGLYVLK